MIEADEYDHLNFDLIPPATRIWALLEIGWTMRVPDSR